MVEHPPGLCLVPQHVRERLLGHTAVLELAEHELIVASEEGAAGVAVVFGLGLLAIYDGEEVVDEDGCLRCDGGGSLAVG